MRCQICLAVVVAVAGVSMTETASAQYVTSPVAAPVPVVAGGGAVGATAPVLAGPQALPIALGNGLIAHPTIVPPSPGGPIGAIAPQQAFTVTSIPPAYQPPAQTQIFGQGFAGQGLAVAAQPVPAQAYTPTYYWYYYAPPYQVSYQAPMMMSVDPSLMGGIASPFGPMFNARGEAGHVRYPYYSYRRPWYYPGQPSFNVNIDGPVW